MTMLNKGLKPVLYDKDKAVSPIIATILLVAITVILASTLYLALGGFFSHTTTAAPSVAIGATNTTSSPVNNFTYSISIGSTSSSTIAWSSTDWVVTVGSSTVTLVYVANEGIWISPSTAPSTAGSTVYVIYGESGTYIGSGQVLTLSIYATSAASSYHTGSLASFTSTPNPVSVAFIDTSTSGGGQMGTTSL